MSRFFNITVPSNVPRTDAINTYILENSFDLFKLNNSGFKATLSPTTLTGNRTYTFPNASGTIPLLESANIFTTFQQFKTSDGNLMKCRSTSGLGYISFYEGDTETRLSFIGKGSPTNNNLVLHTDLNAIEIDSKTNIFFVTNNTQRMEITDNGNIGFAVTPVSSIRCDIKGFGTSISTYPLFIRDGSGNPLFYTTDSGFAWFSGEISAAVITDRTPYPESLQEAIEAVKSMERLPDGEYDPLDKERQLDHSKLHPFIQGDRENRSLSSSVSCLNEVVKHLLEEIQNLNERIKILEAKNV